MPFFNAKTDGREIFSIWSFPLTNQTVVEEFYTDANGLEMIQRNTTLINEIGLLHGL